jgi:hypothetical protein
MKRNLVRRGGLVVLVVCVLGLAPGCAAPTPVPTATPLPRQAILSELKNEVLARSRAEVQWQTAAEGQALQLGGGVQTKAEAKARVDISDGTILRFAANTVFEFKALSPLPADPVTRLYLEAGKVWVSITKALGAGSFDVETPVGVAGVRGSMLSVEYDPASGQMTVTCLEGQCRLTGANGAAQDLQAGEQAAIPGQGQSPAAKQAMPAEQLASWQANFPEAAPALSLITPMPTSTATLPPPTRTPQPTQTPTLVSTATPTATVDVNAALSPEEKANLGDHLYTFTARYTGNCSGETSGTRQVHIAFEGDHMILEYQAERTDFAKIAENVYLAGANPADTVKLTLKLDGFHGEGQCASYDFKK